MKPYRSIGTMLASLLIILLTGCSLLSEFDQSVEYVDSATTYINDVASFGEELSAHAQEAALSAEAVENMRNSMETMKENVIDFNALDAPAAAEEIHQTILGYNEALMREIDQILTAVNADNALNAIKESEILQTVQQMIEIQERLEMLGL